MVQYSDLTGLLLVVIAITIVPFIAMVVTCYMKIVVVLGLLRNALGVQQVPPNMVLNGIAILVSAYVLAPVAIAARSSPGGKFETPMARARPRSRSSTSVAIARGRSIPGAGQWIR